MVKFDKNLAKRAFFDERGRNPEPSELEMVQQMLTAIFWLVPQSSCAYWFNIYRDYIVPDYM